MNSITIDQLLNEQQLGMVLEIMRKPNYHEPLTKYLESIEPKLESKGILPAYFAYWLEARSLAGGIK